MVCPSSFISLYVRADVFSALVVRNFIETTSSQLTYHGLFTLSATLEPHALVARFRNSHLSVLYKHPEGGLYTLVTDSVFFNEPSVVWERLEDVDGGWSTFVDADFVRSSSTTLLRRSTARRICKLGRYSSLSRERTLD